MTTGQQLIEALEEAAEPQLTPYDHFLMKHMSRVTMWLNDHPAPNKFKPLPIEFDGKQYHWLNREQRRRK